MFCAYDREDFDNDMIIVRVILMIMVTNMTEKYTIIVNFE